nr:GTPase HflX [Micavibrio sp.]
MADQKFIDFSEQQGRALVVHPHLNSAESSKLRHKADLIEEICGLANAIHLNIAGVESFNLPQIQAGAYLGKGQRELVATKVEELQPDIVIFNCTLTPVQQRNLEKDINSKVIDRTGLILEIFGARAQTKEGRLQVELAALDYQRSRLVRSWTHLERQRGGAGFMGGPGERQIELDRRIIDQKIVKLKKELATVKRTRELGRKARAKVPFPVVALVGYTNAGKSTLFNTLTDSKVFAKDLLFATLAPTLRKLALPSGLNVILSDTVGFISDLPTHLIAAFRATLEETLHADVILHVCDV